LESLIQYSDLHMLQKEMLLLLEHDQEVGLFI
jgi:hypothetical protein